MRDQVNTWRPENVRDVTKLVRASQEKKDQVWVGGHLQEANKNSKVRVQIWWSSDEKRDRKWRFHQNGKDGEEIRIKKKQQIIFYPA